VTPAVVRVYSHVQLGRVPHPRRKLI
jgi:hypothetical protein